jgi:hypothetical protein
MYYTAGWGTVATTAVAVVALIVTTTFSSLTLRAAASKFAAEKSERL